MATSLTCLLVLAALVFLARGGGRLLMLYCAEPVGIGIPLATGLLMLAIPQMADMMAATIGGTDRNGVYNEQAWHQLGLGGGVFALGFQGWFWMRAALNARAGWRDAYGPANMDWQHKQAPRLVVLPTAAIALSPIFAVVFGTSPWASVPWVGVIFAFFAAAALIWLAWRRPVWTRLVRKTLRLVARFGPPPPLPRAATPRLFAAAPFQPAVAPILLAIGVAGFAAAQWAPDDINDKLHTATAALLAMSCLVPVMAVLLAMMRDLAWLLLVIATWAFTERTPAAWTRVASDDGIRFGRTASALGFLLLLTLPIAGAAVAEAARIDRMPRWKPPAATQPLTAGAPTLPARPTIDAAVTAFQNCIKNTSTPGAAVIVAAEGGASRSAAWTLSVLRMMDALTEGTFGTHLFAISSVSGGSLGAVTYLMARTKHGGMNNADALRGSVELARADLLVPGVARMLTADVLFGLPRRGDALTHAFEHFWALPYGYNLGDQSRLSFRTLRQHDGCLPHLLLNGTDVATGDRVLTSTLAVGVDGPSALQDIDPDQRRLHPFASAIDVLQEADTDIAPSVAVLNSARFPLISPSIKVIRRNPASADGPIQIIDGGVFENYGARTAWELGEAIRARLDPIIVMVTDDDDAVGRQAPPTLCEAPKDTAKNQPKIDASARGGIRIPDSLTSLLGLYSTRGAHGRAELSTMRRRYCAPMAGGKPGDKSGQDSLFLFELAKPNEPSVAEVPMNWVLDGKNCAYIMGDARLSPNNLKQAVALMKRLGVHKTQEQVRDALGHLPEAGMCRDTRSGAAGPAPR